MRNASELPNRQPLAVSTGRYRLTQDRDTWALWDRWTDRLVAIGHTRAGLELAIHDLDQGQVFEERPIPRKSPMRVVFRLAIIGLLTALGWWSSAIAVAIITAILTPPRPPLTKTAANHARSPRYAP